MPAIYLHRHVVRPDEIDELGHAHHLSYLRWMADAALAHSAAQGWPAEAYHALGAGFVVRSHEIKYRREALEGDELVVRTWVADMKRCSSLRRYRIERLADDALLATAATEWAFMDFTTRSLARVPTEIAAAFEIPAEEPGATSGKRDT